MTKSVLLSVVVLVLGASGCKSTPAPAPVGVLLITLDTTRADRLSPYGFMDVSMPHLERLAREGVVFDQAMSVAPLTLPAHVSLFTGLFPPRHGVRENDSPPLAKGHLTLAERLDAQGFATAASVGSVVLDGDRGLQQGFEQYSQVATGDLQGGTPGQRNAESVVNDAIHWLDTVGDSRFFLWTHLYDPHRPYDPPEPFASRHASDLYIGEIAYVDSQIGRLLDTLDRQRLLDRTIVVVAGDHGESLGEHGERDHGIFLYENVLRVPLIIRTPVMPPRRVGSLVRLVDVMPTVLDLLGLPGAPTDGVSLMNLMAGGSRELDAYAESEYPRRFGWSPLRSVRDSRFKLIDAPRPELYDLQLDPFEERNVYAERRMTARAMMQRLRSLAGNSAAGDAVIETPADGVAMALQQRLSALGYVAKSPTRDSPPRTKLGDPKDFVKHRALP